MKFLPELLCVAAIVLFAVATVYLFRRFRAGELPDIMAELATALLWDVVFLLLLPLMFFMAGLLGIFLWLASIVIAMIIAVRYRQAERRALVWSITVATEKSIPLPTAIRAYADERHGNFARRARRLAKYLEQGMPLDAALHQSRMRLPDDVLLALRMGAKTGTMHDSLKSAAGNLVNIDIALQSIFGQIAYLTTVLLFVGGTTTFLLIEIMPALIKIFTDFHRKLPEAAVVLIVHPLAAIWICVIVTIVLAGALARYSGLIRWDPPLLRRLWRQLDEAAVMRSLALTVDRQDAIPATIARLAEKYPQRHIRRRLRWASSRVSAGTDWCDALNGAGLLQSTDAGVLQAAQRVGNLPWALNAIADRLQRRFMTRMTLIGSVGFPLVLLLIASAVCLVALSIFASMANLISSLA